MTLFEVFQDALAQGRAVTLVTVVAGPHGVGSRALVLSGGQVEGSISPSALIPQVIQDVERLLREERSDTLSYRVANDTFEVFVDTYPAPPQIIIVGASHAAGPLTTFARHLGYFVVVADARAAFAVPERFPDADRVVKGWPQDVLPALRLDESTYVVLLSHDPKFDEPTLQQVLPSPVPYIGAIGSRKTQAERFARLREAGYSDEQLGRVYGPVGLDLGGRSPEETALAIVAEITAVRHGRSGSFMRSRTQV